jgi:hypothetical protein
LSEILQIHKIDTSATSSVMAGSFKSSVMFGQPVVIGHCHQSMHHLGNQTIELMSTLHGS